MLWCNSNGLFCIWRGGV